MHCRIDIVEARKKTKRIGKPPARLSPPAMVAGVPACPTITRCEVAATYNCQRLIEDVRQCDTDIRIVGLTIGNRDIALCVRQTLCQFSDSRVILLTRAILERIVCSEIRDVLMVIVAAAASGDSKYVAVRIPEPLAARTPAPFRHERLCRLKSLGLDNLFLPARGGNT